VVTHKLETHYQENLGAIPNKKQKAFHRAIAIDVTQVMASSNGLDAGRFVRLMLIVAAVGWKSGKSTTFSKARLNDQE